MLYIFSLTLSGMITCLDFGSSCGHIIMIDARTRSLLSKQKKPTEFKN